MRGLCDRNHEGPLRGDFRPIYNQQENPTNLDEFFQHLSDIRNRFLPAQPPDENTAQPTSFFFFFSFKATPAAYGNYQVEFESELQLLAHATAIAMLDLSHICNHSGSFWQRQIPNPLSEARDQIHILLDSSQILNPLRHNRHSKASQYLD